MAKLRREVVDRHADEEEAPQRVKPQVPRRRNAFSLGLHRDRRQCCSVNRSTMVEFLRLCAIICAAGGCALAAADYPAARRGAQVDDYFGEKVSDPYRWMEDIDSPETAAWIAAERAYTKSAFAGMPERAAILGRLR